MRAVVAGAAAAVLAATAHGAASQSTEVTMPAKVFAPRELDVLVGTTVTWRNSDTATHTVTEDDDVFDSGHVRPGDTFSRRFAQQGSFVYHCTIHRFMRGRVNVFQVVLRGPQEPLVAGRRARVEGVAPAGATEVVLERVLPRPVTEVARAVPEEDGAFAFVLRAPEPRSYRVRSGPASSPVVTVRVVPRVAIASRGGAIAVSVRPARPGSRVALQVYERERFDFVTVARGRLDASSRATIPFAAETEAHVRAVVRGSGGWGEGRSRTILVRPPSR